jgi:NAD(P)H-hydrate epimerase
MRMIGAPVLSATAALRVGAGLAKLVMPEPVIDAALGMCWSATGVPLAVDELTGEIIAHEAAGTLDSVFESATVVAIGPGLGHWAGSRAATMRAIQQEELPVVVDADALNCLAATPEFVRDFRAAAVLTPHPGEFKRLCEGMGMKGDLGLAESREKACEQMAQRLGRVVVLKGEGTVVSDGLRTWVCTRGHPCMATGGTGDVLTGVIAGLIAQYCPRVGQMLMRAKAPAMPADPARPLDLYDAARVGVWIHAVAGEAWAAAHGASGGMLAAELAGMVPAIAEKLRVASA